MTRRAGLHGTTPAALGLGLPHALRAALQMCRERVGLSGIELAIDIGRDQRRSVLAVHFTNLGAMLPRAARCSLSRARARRDMTVPIGKTRMSAISR